MEIRTLIKEVGELTVMMMEEVEGKIKKEVDMERKVS